MVIHAFKDDRELHRAQGVAEVNPLISRPLELAVAFGELGPGGSGLGPGPTSWSSFRRTRDPGPLEIGFVAQATTTPMFQALRCVCAARDSNPEPAD